MIPEHHLYGGREGLHKYELLLPYINQQVFPLPARTDDDRSVPLSNSPLFACSDRCASFP